MNKCHHVSCTYVEFDARRYVLSHVQNILESIHGFAVVLSVLKLPLLLSHVDIHCHLGLQIARKHEYVITQAQVAVQVFELPARFFDFT